LHDLFREKVIMKFGKRSNPTDGAAVQPEPPAGKPATKPSDLGLTERRHTVRPLPVAQVVESDGDTDWATFQALIADKPNS
jgi:hypothetical protein